MGNQDTKNQSAKSEERLDEGVPQPPHFERRLQIAPLQLIGILLLAILPLLALLGVFGEATEVRKASNEQISIQVEYVTRYRYRMQDSMTVAVTNLTQVPSTISVAVNRDYIEHFSDVSFVPQVDRVMSDAYEVDLRDMKPNETRVVSIQMQGEQYWTQEGTVTAALAGAEPITVEVSTTIFP